MESGRTKRNKEKGREEGREEWLFRESATDSRSARALSLFYITGHAEGGGG